MTIIVAFVDAWFQVLDKQQQPERANYSLAQDVKGTTLVNGFEPMGDIESSQRSSRIRPSDRDLNSIRKCINL